MATKTPPVPEPVLEALIAASRAPADREAWDRLEALAVEQRNPLAVAEGFRKVLGEPHPPALLLEIGERAARFHQEWLADRPALLVEVLERVLQIDPSTDWAWKRLCVVLTLEERWDQLLGAHDRALAVVTERARRVELLEEAAQVAKDFVGDADRAVGYLKLLLEIKPGDWQVAAALERLLERQERWRDLVTLWRTRIDSSAPDVARALRLRIAVTELDRLASPAAALAEARRLLEPPGGGARKGKGQDQDQGKDDEAAAAALALVERVVALAEAPVELRLEALHLAEARYDRTARPEQALAVVRSGLGFASGRDRAALHRNLARRLVDGGAPAEAAQQLGALLALEPDDLAVEDQLRRLAGEIQDSRPYARGLADAAANTGRGPRRVALLLEAGHVHERLLDDGPAAIAFYDQAVSEPEAAAPERLRALRRLDELLDVADRAPERVEVLELLGELPPRATERRAALAALARLATRLKDVDRAARAWERRLDDAEGMEGADREALDGLVDLLASAERWRPLIVALRRRMGAPVAEHQRRADLARIARVQATSLADPAAAIESWTEHEKTFGPSLEGGESLADLLAATARWAEVGVLLTETAERDRERAATLATRLGETCRIHLGAPERAAGWYRRALEADPRHAGARQGLVALVAHPSSRAAAVAALLDAAAKTDDWALTRSLLEPRLALALSPAASVVVLREAARLAEERANDPRAALTALCRALPLGPEDRAVESEALRLAGQIGGAAAFNSLTGALAAAIAALAPGGRRRVELLALLGDLRAARLDDNAGALAAYREALDAEPGRLDLRRLVIRTAGRVGRWDDAAVAALAPVVARETRRDDLIPLCETQAAERSGSPLKAGAETNGAAAAGDGASAGDGGGPATTAGPGAFAPLAAATAEVLAHSSLAPAVAVEIENTIAGWHLDRLHDPAAAEAALVRALDRLPEDLPTLRRLAELQRRAPGARLYQTLLRIAALVPADLDPLAEAAEIACNAQAATPERGRMLETAGRLYDQAARLCVRGARPEGTRTAVECVRLALEILVAGYVEGGRPEDLRRAVAVQTDGAALPLPAEVVRALRRSAAVLAEERLGDRSLAIGIRRVLLEADPDDGDSAAALAALYTAEDRLVDLAELRRRQLERVTDPERRLVLRLDIERLGALLEERSDRVALLRANLADRPGHPPTVDAIATVLDAKRRHAELADVLEEQARLVEDRGEVEPAADLWVRLGRIAEAPLGDRRRAIAAFERAAEGVPAAATLDALGRLCMQEGDAEAAARWLDRRLDVAEAADAPAVVLLLARAYLACDRRHRAVACLERVLVQQPAAGEVRRVLGDLYRGSSSWEPLAQLLTDATAYLSDAEELAVAAREAHRLFRDEVKSPARALPALERAAAARPDAELALALCEAFVAAGRLDEARTQLQRMLKGARRASERAALHHQLGRVARAQGDMAASIAELEQAAAVDRSDPKLLRLLGDTARDAGQADRAERAYRGLLMLLRRSGAGAGQAGVSTVETLLALQELASERGEADKAAELLDSAFEVAAHDRDELGRLRERLDRRGDLAPLAKALERRAAASRGPAEQADVYRELAEIRARMGDRAGALEAELAALQATPEDATLRVRARDRARAAGLVDRYVSALEAIADRRRRRDDGALVASLLLLAGEAIESDLGDAPRALAVFQRAADTSELRAEAASALARVGAACNPAVRARALDRLARLGREAPSPEAQADALFRLAEARLGQPDTRAAGMEALGAALERVPALDRALALVRDAAVPSEELRQVLPLYERLARASGDNRMLLDCLERRAAEADAGVDVVREGYELAVALREDDRAEALLGRLIGVGRGRSGANGAVPGAAWGLTERSRRLRARGELAGAERALVEALEVGDAAVVLPLLRDLAAEAMGTGGDVAVAVRVYETLRARMPGDDRIWETLFDLYARTDDRPALARLVQGALEQLVSPAARNGVRMRYVRYLLDRDPADHTAVDVLRDVLLDEGDHDEAAARLTEVYERQGEEGLLVELLDHRRQRLVERADAAGARAAAVKVAQLLAAEQADRAVEVLAEALAQQPGESSLVEALLALLPTDAADPRLQRIDEVLGAQPDQSAMRAAREAGYRTAELWEPLADLLVEQAEHESVTQEAAANLREAASIHTTRLFDLPTAVELLRRARELDPYDVDLVRELVGLLVDLGETRRAQAEAFAASRSPNLPRDVRARLLALRAELLSASGQRDAAIAVLLEATGYAGPELKKELFAMVERLRSGPAAAEAKADPGVEDVTDLVEITDQ